MHGGAEFHEPIEIDDEVLSRLEALTPLAPLHQLAGLVPMRCIRELRPRQRQFACFDTGFHRTLQPPASLCAMRGLESVDTTMGFSVLDGLVMGTRPGSLDPGILLYLLKEKGSSAEELEHLLYRESGLLGVSGISADVATLLASDAAGATDALDLFAFQVARHTAALAATLEGLDRLVFTGGIGENASTIRKMIVQRLEWLGAALDDQANDSGAAVISKPGSILLERRPTQEKLAIASQVAKFLCWVNALRPCVQR